MFAAATWSFALVLGVVLVAAWLIYGAVNIFGKRAHKEVGAELELAPNRKPYYDDDALEGPRLERVQLLGLVTLAVIVIALPLYWLFEPSREAGAARRERPSWRSGVASCSPRPLRAASTAPAATAA